MKELTISEAVTVAGGPVKVAAKHGLTYQAVRMWEKRGLPRTEWSGETNYSGTLARMCAQNGRPEFTRAALLKISKQMRNAA